MLDSFLFAKHMEEDEHVAVIVHKHWLIGLKFLFWPTLSFLLSWATLFLVFGQNIIFYIVALWSMSSIVWWLRYFFDYYLDAWIITNMGIIDLEWHGWFHRQSTRVLYGVINVEKISTGSVFSLTHVSRPLSVEAVILKNMEAYLHSKNLKDAKHVQELLAGLVAGQMQMGGTPPGKKK